MPRSLALRSIGVLLAMAGLLFPIVGFGLLLLFATGAAYSDKRGIIVAALIFSSVVLIPMGIALYAIGKHAPNSNRKGLCPACGYPIGVSDVCTECGRPVR